VPYLIGVMLFPPVMAVALWRARVVPLWAMLVVIGGSASFAVFAGPWWVTVVWGVALLAGFSPAVRLALRGTSRAVPTAEPVGVTG